MSAFMEQWKQVLAEIEKKDSFALLTHVRPDGDAYGSLLAFGLALESIGKKVLLFNEDGVLERYQFLPGINRVQKTPLESPSVDVVVSLDNAAYNRLGKNFLNWQAPIWLNIDHHISNEQFGKYNLIDGSVPATGQLLYELMSSAGWKITPEIADNLFVAISTDTGSFKYRSTTARTFEVAAALSRAGAHIAEMSQFCYASYPLRRTKLLKEILQRMEFRCGDRLVFYPITQSMYADTQAKAEDTEGLIESILCSQGVELAIAFEERTDGSVKMSFRSKGSINVSELATRFKGGGHREAAGAQLVGNLEQVKEKVLASAEEALSAIA